MSVENQVILITGGAGSLGRHLLTECLKTTHNVKTVRILDHNENQIAKLRRKIKDSRVRWFLGDITDRKRMERAMENVDICIHCAAQKHVDLAEYNPFFSIQTNVLGTQNCIDVSLKCDVAKFLFISSDKAVQAISTYGRCKALSESLTLDANNYKGDHRTLFSVARPPNYINSDGSVFEVWKEQKAKDEPLTVTHADMTRYFLSFSEIIKFTMKCVALMEGGEIFVPSGAKKRRIIELAQEISSNIQITGMRPGEKLDELLIDPAEVTRAKLVDGIWVIR